MQVVERVRSEDKERFYSHLPGEPNGIRTHDLRNASAALFRLSIVPAPTRSFCPGCTGFCGYWDSATSRNGLITRRPS